MRRWAILIAGGLGWAALSSVAGAQAPPVIPVQGHLTDAGGVALDGEVMLGFSFYPTDTGGAAAFTESQMVQVEQGFFTAYVGDSADLDLALFRDSPTLYLGIRVGAEPEMTPRLLLGSVPYAAYAEHAGPGVQRRVSGACPPGQAISSIAEDGAVECVSVGAGAATARARSTVVVSDTEDTEIASIDVTFPADGQAIVIGEASFSARDAANGWLDCDLVEDGGADSTAFYWDAGDDDGWFDLTQQKVWVKPVSAGPHTYVLRCRQRNSGGSPAQATFRDVSVVFVPGSI